MKGRCMYLYEIKRTIARLKVATCATLAVCWLASYAIAGVPAAHPVVIVLEDNHSYSSVVGNTSSMPYLNSPAGTVNVTVTNPDAQSATLVNGYTYNPAPTATSISPASGTTLGGTSVTITGTNFISGATV